MPAKKTTSGPRYAANTSVPAEKTRAEIERVLTRYGATGFAYGWKASHARMEFEMRHRRVRVEVPLPDPEAEEFRYGDSWRRRSDSATHAAYEQAVRQRWRAILLIVKAKLEAVESDILLFDDAWLAETVLPNGQTYGEFARPQIDQVYREQRMPPLLPGTSTQQPSKEIIDE